MRRLAGAVALGALLASAAALGAGAAGQRALFIVPAAKHGFPGWLAGPLAPLGLQLDAPQAAALLAALFACYLVLVGCAGDLPGGVVIASIVVLHIVFLIAPPLFSADVFSYIDYARLGALHGLDPYTHGAASAAHDPVTRFVRWHDVPSAYGPLFTLAGYTVAHASLAVTYWVYKAVAALAGLGCVAFVWRLAARRGHDPRRAATFVGMNPLFVVYGVGGAHNDELVMLIALAAIASALRERERRAGVALALAALTKVSCGLVAPFLMIGARHRGRALAGIAAGAAAVAVLAVVLLGRDPFGFVAQLFAQQRAVAHFSVPNQLGLLLDQPGLTAPLRRICVSGFAISMLWLLWRAWRGADWIACAGWATFASLVTSAWLLPWYAVWLLPLSAITPSRALRACTLGFCAYLLATRVLTHL